MLLWKELADESASRCCTSATRDWKTVTCRFEHEGFSFLTITLPQFGKDFEKSLDQGAVDRNLFQGFSWREGLPRFLGGFLDRVFDRCGGVLLDTPDIDAILAIRQLTLLFSKVLFPCSDARVKNAIYRYAECEQDVREHDLSLSSVDKSDFKRISSLLYSGLFSKVDYQIYYNELSPKHGPGATADKLRGNAKYRQKTWTRRLDSSFPVVDYLLPNPSYYDGLNAIDILEPGAELPVRVISVPKTQKTPRIIAVEPTAMQYAQQAVYACILEHLKGNDTLSKLIGFSDQTPNQRMAREGSLYGKLATLDLSEASDRVSNQHVRMMLEPHPHLHEAVDACRSRKADVNGKIIRLSKFASMGSALCFPFEAMVFTTLIFMGIEKELNTPLTYRTIESFVGQVRVYGDDILVPVDYVQSVVGVLESFGIRVNSGKSFWTGSFRESCGKDFYAGHDVSVVKVRHDFPTRRAHATEVISIISLRNQLYFAGYWETCKWLDERIRGIIQYFPVVLPSSPVQGRHSFLGFKSSRLGEHLHNPLVRGYVVSSRLPSDPLEDAGALLKCLLNFVHRDTSESWDRDTKLSNLPVADAEHLLRAGRPQSLNIKLRWASAI